MMINFINYQQEHWFLLISLLQFSPKEMMTYKELLNHLQQLNEEQLNQDVMIQDYDNEYHGYKVELVFATDAQNVLDVDHPIIRF